MSLADYDTTITSLYALEAAKGMDFKLERVTLALHNLGNPQQAFRSIHIAGTNGKGSVAAMLHAMYGAAGYRVGLYTSPHLVDFRERIRIGVDMIDEASVVQLAQEIHGASMMRGVELTFFEFVTVMGFLHFARQGVDIAVIEVGLGGRLDATNVIVPEVSVITTIGLDHEEYLGGTTSLIAAEKGGIIKPRRPVVMGAMDSEACAVIERMAERAGAPLTRLGVEFAIEGDEVVTYRSACGSMRRIRVGLRGCYQNDNAAVAIAATEAVRGVFPISEDAVRSGLMAVRWPGRLEVMDQSPLLIFDGAHNPAAVAALVEELPAILGERRTCLLFGVMKDKRWREMVDNLISVVDVVVTVCADPVRGEDPEELAAAFSALGHGNVHVAENPVQGIARACALAGAQGAVVVAGSLFLIGAVYPRATSLTSDAIANVDSSLELQ